MNIYIINASHNGFDWAQLGIQTYIKRIPRFAKLHLLPIKQQKLSSITVSEAMRLDAIAIREKLPKQSHIILCHETGKQYDSKQFAQMIDKSLLGNSSITFVVGPAYGLSRELIKSFSLLSLSKMTLQHEIAELLLYEQIYRALTIINNHPYHR